MKYIFGKSEAAMILEEHVRGRPELQAKVSNHISKYFRYVDVVSCIPEREVRIKALSLELDCNLDVPIKVKTLIRNVKVAKRRQALCK